MTDEVLLVTDTPNPACLAGPSCDALVRPKQLRRQMDGAAARAAAASRPAVQISPVALDPRIDQVDQAGECAFGASNSTAVSSCGR